MAADKKITIKDVAKMANVSVSTVSRVLNNAIDVNPNTRARILEIISKFEYKPNPAAKALVNKICRYVAVVVPNIYHSSISKIVQSIMNVCHENNFDVLLFDFCNNGVKERRFLQTLDDKLIDGIILITSTGEDSDIIQLASKLPTVAIERCVKSDIVDSVVCDEKKGMNLLVEHLTSYGHKKIAYINGLKESASAKRRLQAFLEATKRHDLLINPDYIVNSPWSLTGGRDVFTRLMKDGCDATAVICASDQIALGAIGAAYQLKINVPEQMSVVGFDNFEAGQVSVPPLTTLDYPSEGIGTYAATQLLRRINDMSVGCGEYVLDINILTRASVGSVGKID